MARKIEIAFFENRLVLVPLGNFKVFCVGEMLTNSWNTMKIDECSIWKGSYYQNLMFSVLKIMSLTSVKI